MHEQEHHHDHCCSHHHGDAACHEHHHGHVDAENCAHHEHDHAHTHVHTHNGHTHGHEHHHSHSHGHEHSHTPLEELLALMKYMTGHNAAHARELADLAHQLAHAGSDAAYDKVMSAVAKFDEGNAILDAVLQELSI